METKKRPILIDTHVHLSEIASPTEALQRAWDAGVVKIVAVGMDIESNRVTLEYSRRFPGRVVAAIGYHPWSIKPEEIDATLEFMDEHLDECVAIGEVGLDYKAKTKKALQQEVFFRILQLALKKDLPIIVHSRYSHHRSFEMVLKTGIERAVFHWYGGPLEILEKIIANGYLISATPALSYSEAHRAAVLRAPIERILIETDSPVKYQDRISEPADIVITLRELSKLKNIPFGELAVITANTARKFFQLSD